jgi:hypothetical protein
MTPTDATDEDDSNERQDRSPASPSGTGPERRSRGRRSVSTGPLPGEYDVVEYVYWGGLIVCSILAIVALINFYTSATHAISVWVAAKYEPVIQSAFALVVLLAALVGVSLTVRELSPSGTE